MRASEFLQEERGLRLKHKKGKAPHVHQAASPGHVRSKGYYDMYRATMAMAGMDSDGNNENMPDPESWIGGDGLVNALTDEERSMAKKAFSALGMPSKEDSSHTGSREPDGVNSGSPIVAFKGYPR
jgi:hypothetical protein